MTSPHCLPLLCPGLKWPLRGLWLPGVSVPHFPVPPCALGRGSSLPPADKAWPSRVATVAIQSAQLSPSLGPLLFLQDSALGTASPPGTTPSPGRVSWPALRGMEHIMGIGAEKPEQREHLHSGLGFVAATLSTGAHKAAKLGILNALKSCFNFQWHCQSSLSLLEHDRRSSERRDSLMLKWEVFILFWCSCPASPSGSYIFSWLCFHPCLWTVFLNTG